MKKAPLSTGPGDAFDVTRAVEIGLASWLVITALSQHPNRSFDRLRRLDPIGFFIPNWRFFAPVPAQHDIHLLYRTLSTKGVESPWKAATTITPRSWRHSLWFPSRREEKAVFDICSQLPLRQGEEVLTKSVAYRLLSGYVKRRIRESDPVHSELKGYQFLVAQYSGYDHSEEPEYMMVSPFVPVDSQPGPNTTRQNRDDRSLVE